MNDRIIGCDVTITIGEGKTASDPMRFEMMAVTNREAVSRRAWPVRLWHRFRWWLAKRAALRATKWPARDLRDLMGGGGGLMGEETVFECDQCKCRAMKSGAVNWIKMSPAGLDATACDEKRVSGLYCCKVCASRSLEMWGLKNPETGVWYVTTDGPRCRGTKSEMEQRSSMDGRPCVVELLPVGDE